MFVLDRWSVKHRLILLTTIFALIGCACVAVGTAAVRQLSDRSQQVFRAKDALADTLPPPLYLIELRLLVSRMLEGNEPADEARKDFARLQGVFQERHAHWRAQAPTALATLAGGAQVDSAQALFRQADTMIREMENLHVLQAQSMLVDFDAIYLRHRQAVDATVAACIAFADQELQDYEATARTSFWSQIVVLVLGLLTLIALAAGILRSILRPLHHAVEVAESVAQGDLRHAFQATTPKGGRSEMARLERALQNMCQGLAAIVGQVRASSLRLAEATTQLAAGSEDLRCSTATHQGDLKITTHSVREIQAMVEQNARSAQDANQLVAVVSEGAQAGGVAMNSVAGTMDEIAASSRQVAEIVHLIDGIAFQTNILAINASVEAARAGVHGRGFAVVADEVRQLSNRTAAAAREIGSLVGQSVRRVQTGHGQAQDASAAVQAMVGRTQEMSGHVQGIWETTFAQSSGINLLVEALDELSSAMEANVALVSQTTGLSQGLRDDAASLAEIVGRFRLAEVTAVSPEDRTSRAKRAGERDQVRPAAASWQNA